MFNFVVLTVLKKVVIILPIPLVTRNTRLILSQEVTLTVSRSVPMTVANEKSEIPLHAPNETKSFTNIVKCCDILIECLAHTFFDIDFCNEEIFYFFILQILKCRLLSN